MMQVPAIANMKESSFADSVEQLQQPPVTGSVRFRDPNDSDWQLVEVLPDNFLTFELGDSIDVVGLQRRIVPHWSVVTDTIHSDGAPVNEATNTFFNSCFQHVTRAFDIHVIVMPVRHVGLVLRRGEVVNYIHAVTRPGDSTRIRHRSFHDGDPALLQLLAILP